MWDMAWKLNQQNRICFVMVDVTYTEVAGLGNTFNIFISKNGGGFVAGAGAKGEIGNGWYTYYATAAEADTIGPVAIYVTGAGCIQQNLEYVVEQRTSGCIDFTYTVTTPLLVPLENVEVCITTDIAGVNIIWKGYTDAFGVARDDNGELPCLDAGTYYFWRKLAGYTFTDPDTEVVS